MLVRFLIAVLAGFAVAGTFGIPVVGGMLGFLLAVFAILALAGLTELDRELEDD